MAELARGRGRTGTVTAFDAAVGLGTIESDEGEPFGFHCIEIADGSRDIAPGTPVSFDLLSKLGRHEAANIRR
ncbi:MAG: cold shock domain-containing protein [Ilumatobacter sp.]